MADSQPSSSNAEPTSQPEDSPTTDSSASSSLTPTKSCTRCHKTETLKPCSKCQSVQYCSRECQKADFKNHKKVCAKEAQIYAQGANLKMEAPGARAKKAGEGHRGGLQKWQFDT